MTTKTPIPRQSEKRKAAIADGTYVKPPRKPIARKPFGKVLAGSPAASKLLKRAFGAKPKGTRSKAMKEADKWFSEWIRLRDSDENGRAKCVTCKHWAHWRELQNGHWISRGEHATRYDERNCATQCGGCNGPAGGRKFDHGLAIDAKYGPAMRGTLEAKVVKWRATNAAMKTADFQFIASTYKERVAWQREHFPGKFTKAA